jgi:hypothetical protein
LDLIKHYGSICDIVPDKNVNIFDRKSAKTGIMKVEDSPTLNLCLQMKKFVFIVLCRREDLLIVNRGVYDCFPYVEMFDGMTPKMALDLAFPKVHFYRFSARFVEVPGTFKFDGQDIQAIFLVVSSFESLQHLPLVPSRRPGTYDDSFVSFYFENVAKKGRKEEVVCAA